MKLLDKEKNEIVNYLKANKNLPEKYRFLLFDQTSDVELSWLGKEYNLLNTSLPFQYIEHVDTPRSEENVNSQPELFDFSGRQLKGANKLIWGDNKLILSSLKNGPLYDEIVSNGGLKLVYIDPPFNTGDNFKLPIEIANNSFIKTPSIMEEIAYRDTWNKGHNSFNQMIYERLLLIYSLLSSDGTIFIHCDQRVNSFIKLICFEIFGKENFINEITWQRSTSGKTISNNFARDTDTILWFSKSAFYTFNKTYKPLSESSLSTYDKNDDDGRGKYTTVALQKTADPGPLTTYDYKDNSGKIWKCPKKGWRMIKEKIKKLENDNRIYYGKTTIREKSYWNERESEGKISNNLWDDIPNLQGKSREITRYPTQKPNKLLERIILSASNEGDLVADFFCGSGTTLEVAEKFNRKWIGSDLSKFAIHLCRKRLIETQRNLKKDGKSYRAFEVLNLGKYERQYYVKFFDFNKKISDKIKYINFNEFKELIIQAYNAKEIKGYKFFDAFKNNSLIHIGPVDYPVTREDIMMIIEESEKNKITSVHILAFEYEMGLFPAIINEALEKGISIQAKKIPNDVFDERAIKNREIKFFDVSYVDVKIHIKKDKEVAVELIKYSPNYSQENTSDVIENLKDGKKINIIENSNIIEISKKNNKITRKPLIKKWSDWVDYWSVDFDYESKPEVIEKTINGKKVLEHTGSHIFENEWQDFIYRNKKGNIELKTPFHPLKKKKQKIAIRVIDVFANDTMIIKEVNN